tara:strand:+ start:354 stop:530 length:177 start_codon:yes stop_codon:yes gene_type:complete
MKLSDQAMGALMMALQKSLMEQSDITETLRGFDFVISGPSQSLLMVANPPVVKAEQDA